MVDGFLLIGMVEIVLFLLMCSWVLVGKLIGLLLFSIGLLLVLVSRLLVVSCRLLVCV